MYYEVAFKYSCDETFTATVRKAATKSPSLLGRKCRYPGIFEGWSMCLRRVLETGSPVYSTIRFFKSRLFHAPCGVHILLCTFFCSCLILPPTRLFRCCNWGHITLPFEKGKNHPKRIDGGVCSVVKSNDLAVDLDQFFFSPIRY